MLLTILRILFLPVLIILSSPIVTAEGIANDSINSEEVFQRELEAASLWISLFWTKLFCICQMVTPMFPILRRQSS